MFAIATLPGEATGPVEWGQLLLSVVVTLGTVAIFLGALHLVFLLWRTVFHAVMGMNTKEVEALGKLLGGIEIDATTGEEKLGRQGRFRVASVGLLGTMIIVIFAFLTARYALDFRFSNSPQPRVEYVNIDALDEETESLVKNLIAGGYSLRASNENNKSTVLLRSPDGAGSYLAYGDSVLEALQRACEMAKWRGTK